MSHPSKRITQQELESYLWGAAVLLRGLIDAGDYKQFIFPLLFYKRVSDVWEEEYQAALANSGGDLSYAQFAENHRFQIPEGAHWNDVRQAPKNVGAAIQKGFVPVQNGGDLRNEEAAATRHRGGREGPLLAQSPPCQKLQMMGAGRVVIPPRQDARGVVLILGR